MEEGLSSNFDEKPDKFLSDYYKAITHANNLPKIVQESFLEIGSIYMNYPKEVQSTIIELIENSNNTFRIIDRGHSFYSKKELQDLGLKNPQFVLRKVSRFVRRLPHHRNKLVILSGIGISRNEESGELISSLEFGLIKPNGDLDIPHLYCQIEALKIKDVMYKFLKVAETDPESRSTYPGIYLPGLEEFVTQSYVEGNFNPQHN